jgi:SAM-dependent methyltransferase
MTQIKNDLADIQKQYDTFFAKSRDGLLVNWDRVYPRIQKTADKFVQMLEMTLPPAALLDLACGSGGMAAEFARRGYRVTGLDCSSEGLRVAESITQKIQTHAQWILGDMRSFELSEPVDYVLIWDVIFGCCASEAEDRMVISNISNSLKVNGRCLFEVYNKAFAIKAGIEDNYDYDLESDRFMLCSESQYSTISSLKLYTHEEWHGLLQDYGMEIVKIHAGWSRRDDLPGPPYRADYFVAQKFRS